MGTYGTGHDSAPSNGPSRRSFLKGAGLAMGGVTVASLFAGLSGCVGENENATVGVNTEGVYPCVVHESDVVVVGGGLAACTAARRVISAGKTLAIVDKGVFGHSGSSGQNWGAEVDSAENAADGGQGFFETILTDFFGLVDQDWAWAVVQGTREGIPQITIEKLGGIQQRNPDGSVFGTVSPDLPMSSTFDNKVRRHAQYLRRLGADIYDRTMVVDILQDPNGHAAGVVAIDLEDGTAHVFRAKTVVMGTGMYTWSLKPSIMGPEDTGDGHAILAKRGLPLYDMEMTPFDYTVIKPYSIPGVVRESAGILTLNSSVWNRAENSKGEVYGTEYFTSDAHAKNPTAGFVEFEILTMQQIMSGETIYMNTTELNRENPFYPYGMMHGFIVDAPAGIGYTYKNVEECGQCSITSCGHPRQSASMETDIPGLFSCIQALTYYGQAQAFGQGWVSGAAAAIAADEIDLPEISFNEVQDILKKAYGYLAATGGVGGIRSVKVLESIRDASYHALQLPRNDESLQTGLDEYKRIRTEDVPKMYCGSQSRILNYDWKNAMEVENALICCEACAQSSFTRKETRPWFYRSDYQKIDNDNWLKNIHCTYNGEGKWTVGTSEVNASRVSIDEIKGMLRPVDMTAEFK